MKFDEQEEVHVGKSVFYLETSYKILTWHAALSCRNQGGKTQFHIRNFTPTTEKDLFLDKPELLLH